MKEKYIQLPPLPMDLPAEQVEILWLYIKMPKKKRKMILDFMKKNAEGRIEELFDTEFAKLICAADKKSDPDLEEYMECMRRLLGMLLSQACDTAGFVYQHYCVEGKSMEEIAGEYGMDDSILRLMAQYYDRKNKTVMGNGE